MEGVPENFDSETCVEINFERIRGIRQSENFGYIDNNIVDDFEGKEQICNNPARIVNLLYHNRDCYNVLIEHSRACDGKLGNLFCALLKRKLLSTYLRESDNTSVFKIG